MLHMTENERKRSSAPAGSKLPSGYVRSLGDLAATLAALGALGHDRMTVKQSLFFLTVAHAEGMGRSITLTDILREYEGTGSLGGSLIKSYAVFLEPTKRDPGNLGWITQVHDEDDKRVKYLKLTDTGRDVAETLVEALRGA